MNDNDELKRGLFPQEKEQQSRVFRWLFTVLVIIIFLVVGVLLVKSASAKDRHGHGVLVIGEEVDGFTIACDTQEQLVSILTIHAESGFDAMSKQLRTRHLQKDKHGESVCILTTIHAPVTILEKIAVFHDLEFGEERDDVTIIKVNRPDDPKGFFIITTFSVVTEDELAIGQAL